MSSPVLILGYNIITDNIKHFNDLNKIHANIKKTDMFDSETPVTFISYDTSQISEPKLIYIENHNSYKFYIGYKIAGNTLNEPINPNLFIDLNPKPIPKVLTEFILKLGLTIDNKFGVYYDTYDILYQIEHSSE